ncbi:bifunctional folylpolyglutamate synthase/dihydrofolate synthase [Thalassobacillus pellis]|uniref:bifunctional folylpolyglutamate synthase/dihydrofolate synthase n=1 Tax=Thalassobacillus pellis TaxID=748008 RepID=UPI00195F5B17|nr:folylpolyglutamate synthase/dihydrofolate synthase family protein [Thalassobacillus pellis]MBM7554611.1 dihydrofolate synthase/folylpolyglutamate synthase [Thalassobacillus pellis]
MTYEEAIDWIHSREKFKIKPGLKRMEWMMKRLGHPEKGLNAIHIAGTNGKGSTLSFIRSLLQQQGNQVGTFTSPYIITFNERISIDGVPIRDEEWVDLVSAIRPLAEELGETSLGEPTEFEVITAMAILYFNKAELDFVIFEAGLGGRYDSTNIISPIMTVITNIGLDHINILGDTYEQIAAEKAGIIKQGVPLITAVDDDIAFKVIKEEADDKGAQVFRLGKEFSVLRKESTNDGEQFTFTMKDYISEPFLTRLKGRHQVLNASVALAAVEILSIEYHFDRAIYQKGIMSTDWPGRFEQISTNPAVVLDGAHNEEGTISMIDTLKVHFPHHKKYLLYAALSDKPITGMLSRLAGSFDRVIFTGFAFPKSMKGSELLQLYPGENADSTEDWKSSLEDIMSNLNQDDVLVVTGSLYFVSEVRKYLEYRKNV